MIRQHRHRTRTALPPAHGTCAVSRREACGGGAVSAMPSGPSAAASEPGGADPGCWLPPCWTRTGTKGEIRLPSQIAEDGNQSISDWGCVIHRRIFKTTKTANCPVPESVDKAGPAG